MDAKIKADWVAALRSGKYAQTTGQLKDVEANGPAYCCLGVLCDIVGAKWDEDGRATYKDGESSGLLPRTVAKAVGFDADDDYANCQEVDPCVWMGQEKMTLSELNDSGDYTFAQIADIIEEQL